VLSQGGDECAEFRDGEIVNGRVEQSTVVNVVVVVVVNAVHENGVGNHRGSRGWTVGVV
jgi:hypothetical protein